MTLFPKALTAYRNTGSYVGGVWTPGALTEIPFLGSIQPITGKQLEALPIGRTDSGKCAVYSSSDLQVSTENGDNSGDFVIWNGLKYELIFKQVFDNGLIPHTYYVGEDRGPA